MTTYQQPPVPYPYAPPVPAARRVAATWTGFGVLAAGAAAAVGSCLTWIHAVAATGASKDFSGFGDDRDGKITLALGVALAVLGLLVAVKQGRLWVPIVSIVVSAVLALIAFADVKDVSDKSKQLASLGHLDTGIGLYLVLAGSIVGIVCAILGLCVRQRV